MDDTEKRFINDLGSAFGMRADSLVNEIYSAHSTAVYNRASFEEIEKEIGEIKQKLNGVKVTVPEKAEVTKILGLDLTDPQKTYIFVLSFPGGIDKATMDLSVNKFREAIMESSNSVKANIIVFANMDIDVVEGG